MRLLYSALMLLALPVLVLAALWRVVTGAEPLDAIPERLGLGPAAGPGPALWLHGASVGELTSARWLLEGLLEQRPGLQVLVTCNTATARAMVRGWALPGVTAALAPVDTPFTPARVIRRRQPSALVVVENETWPNRMAAAARARVPVILVGARLSERSARRWGKARGLAAEVLGAVTWATAQDEGSRKRLVALGLRPEAIGPDFALKSLAARAGTPSLPGPAPREMVLLAASTHEGEEEPILAAFCAQTRFSHLILAPRHPDRGDRIAALIGPGVPRRSAGALPRPEARIFLADTLGEMDLWYAMAGACLIGGSLVEKGGHTPYEPAAQGCALLHGPSTRNFAAIFAALDAAGAALPVTAETLADTLDTLSPDRQRQMADAAAPLLRPEDDGAWLVTEILRRASL